MQIEGLTAKGYAVSILVRRSWIGWPERKGNGDRGLWRRLLTGARPPRRRHTGDAHLGHLGLIQHEIGFWGKLAAWATYPSAWPEPTVARKVRPAVKAARCGGGHGRTAVRSLREARNHHINAKGPGNAEVLTEGEKKDRRRVGTDGPRRSRVPPLSFTGGGGGG
jgi:hypothetical protein